MSRYFARCLARRPGRLAAAEALAPTEATTLAALTALRRTYPPALAAAAVEQALLRQRAARGGKFTRAAAMYFTREGLEQATGETIARYRARRFARCDSVADLACGLGGDALALAADGQVLAVDRDPLRLLLARENARAYGVAAHIAACAGRLNDPAAATRRRALLRSGAAHRYGPPRLHDGSLPAAAGAGARVALGRAGAGGEGRAGDRLRRVTAARSRRGRVHL